VEIKKIALFLILVVGMVLVNGCIDNVTTTTSSTTYRSYGLRESTECAGCLFISSNYRPHKLKNFVNFDTLSERAKGMNYIVSLHDYPPSREVNQTSFKRVIEIKKNIENYTAQIILSEISHPNETRVQSVDRVYFGVTCDFKFARPRMIEVLDELGVWIQGYPPHYTGLPDDQNEVVDCTLGIY